MEYKHLFGTLLFAAIAISSVTMEDSCMKLKDTVKNVCSNKVKDYTINCNSQPSDAVACIDKALKDNEACTDEETKQMIQAKRGVYDVFCQPESKAVKNTDSQCLTVKAVTFSITIFNAMMKQPVDCKKIQSESESGTEMQQASVDCMKVLKNMLNAFTSSQFCMNPVKPGGNVGSLSTSTSLGAILATLLLVALARLC